MFVFRYGSVVPVNAKDPLKFQHQGFGNLMMEEAERIAKYEHHSLKICVISGSNYLNIFVMNLNIVTFVQVLEQEIIIKNWAI